MRTAMGDVDLYRTANMSRRTRVVVKQMQCNPIQSFGYWAIKAHMLISVGYQAMVALRGMRVFQLPKETIDHDIDPLARVHYAYLKSLVNYYIQQLVQIKRNVCVHDKDPYRLKPTLGPPKKGQYLTRVEEVFITWPQIDHTKATKSHISDYLPTLWTDTADWSHALGVCGFTGSSGWFYTADSLETHIATIPEICIVEFLREAGFYLTWTVKYFVLILSSQLMNF